jgi:hypothetical protein
MNWNPKRNQMPKTFANLRDSLASAIGNYEYANLSTQDQADIDTLINAAYLDCFAKVGGRRPWWVTQYWADMVKAPAAATLGMTYGSKVVTGFAFEAKYAGSYVRIGDSFYRLASVAAGPVYSLVQPWSGTTGTFDATVYYNAVALPGTVVRVREQPSILGLGPLAPMYFPESETTLRSSPSYDFEPRSGRAPFAFSRPRFDPSLITDVGDPRYFHIDSAATGATFATGSRFHLYPLPGAAFTVDLRGDIIPLPLEGANDVPVLPHDDADIAGAILMPLMFDRLLKHPLGRRYSGTNTQAIFQGAAEARAQLNTFRSVQIEGPKLVRNAPGW